jgi:hypothetical protein
MPFGTSENNQRTHAHLRTFTDESSLALPTVRVHPRQKHEVKTHVRAEQSLCRGHKEERSTPRRESQRHQGEERKHAVSHQPTALQRIVDSPGSTEEEIAGARASCAN